MVILVDDGLATGVTMAAAAMAARRLRPARVIAAVPVASATVCRVLEYCADAVVAALVPELFQGIARSYETFDPTSDDEVARLVASGGARRRLQPAVAMPQPSASDPHVISVAAA